MIYLFSLRIVLDPFETQNRASTLRNEEKSYMHDTLEKLKGCRGKGCTIKRHQTQYHQQQDESAVRLLQRGNKRKQGKYMFIALINRKLQKLELPKFCYMYKEMNHK